MLSTDFLDCSVDRIDLFQISETVSMPLRNECHVEPQPARPCVFLLLDCPVDS